MLSEKEYNTILEQVKEPSSNISTNTMKTLQRKLKEHKYSTKFAPFEPLPHIPDFINRTTTEQTLHQIIQAATMSSEFTIDTESFNVFRQTNKPALIQLQIFLPHNSSFVLLVEVHHLPKNDHICFQLIQQLFRIIFVPEKTIYIFGPKQELDPFTEFELFSQDQIDNAHILNLQEKFKIYWNQQHPHRPERATSSTTFNNCLCETCIGKKSSDAWSLQDCVAYLLHEYLPKTLSNENFQIGLDPELFELHHNEQQYRNRLSTYAKNDCLSLQRLIIHMKNDQFDFDSNPIIQTLNNIFNPLREHVSSINPYAQVKQKYSKFKLPILDDELESISSDDDYPTEQQLSNQILSRKELLTPSINIQEMNNELLSTQDVIMTHTPERSVPLADHEHRYPSDWESSLANGNRPDEDDTTEQSSSNKTKLSAEERKRIHNRACTRKQRQRYYRCEIIRRNVDRRFTPKKVKTILREHNISFSAVNDNSKSSTSNKITLYIGIKDADKIDEYEQIIQNLFTTAHYHSWYRNRRQPNHRTSSNRRQSHHQTSSSYQRPHHRTSSYYQPSSNHQQTSNDRQRYQHQN